MPEAHVPDRVETDRDGALPIRRVDDGGVPGGASPSVASASTREGPAKAPDAFRTIGEVTRALDIAPHVLRYWEEQFPMLRPLKRSGGRRYYRPADIALLEDIHRLVHREGYTLRGARRFLEGRDGRGLAEPAGDLLEGLIALRGELARLLDP